MRKGTKENTSALAIAGIQHSFCSPNFRHRRLGKWALIVTKQARGRSMWPLVGTNEVGKLLKSCMFAQNNAARILAVHY